MEAQRIKTGFGGLTVFVVACALIHATDSEGALPFLLKPRPRLYVNSAQLDHLKATVFVPVPLTNAEFPPAGTLSFSLRPSKIVPGDDVFASVFDGYVKGRRHFFIRHDDNAALNSDDCPLQLAFMDDQPEYAASWNGHLSCETWHTFSVKWNGAAATGEVVVDGVASTLTFNRSLIPNGQRFVFSGRGDEFDDIVLASGEGATATIAATFNVDEGKGNLVVSTDGQRRLKLSGDYSWIERSAGNFSVALASGANEGQMQIAPQSELTNSYAALKFAADGFASQLNTGANIYAPDDAVTAHPLRFTTPAKVVGLAWLLTGTESYRTALFTLADQILAVAPASGNDFTQAGRAMALGIIYDWLHDDVTSRTHTDSGTLYRNAIFEFVKATAIAQTTFICGAGGSTFVGSWTCSKGAPVPWATGSHADYNNSEMAAAVLAMVDDFPELENLAKTLLEGDRDVVAPFRDFVAVDGAHHFGYDYGATYTQVFGALVWMTATDVMPLRPYMANLPFRMIYGLRSDNLQPAAGDAYRLSLYADEVSLQAIVGSRFFNNRYAETFFRDHSRGSGSAFFELLLWNPDTPVAAIEELPLVRHFRVAGTVIARGSWDYKNSSLFEIHAPSFHAGNHQHSDSGAFSLYYKAPLLLDSGIYDSYGTSHFYNYYQRTIAHNSIVIFDPSETYSIYGKTYSVEGGQTAMEFLPSLAAVMPGGAASRKGITHFEHNDSFTYLQADSSDAYDATKIDRNRGMIRSVVWLPKLAGHKHPAFFIYDEVTKTAAKASLTTRVLFHSAEEPAPVGGEHVSKCHWKAASNHFSISNGGGVVELETLLPADAVVHKVGGFDGADDCRFLAWDSAGVETNYPPWPEEDPHYTPNGDPKYLDIGSFRLEVMPPVPTQREAFLHFAAVRDEGDAVPRATTIAVTGGVGAKVSGQIVVFASNQERVSIATPARDLMLVVGLIPSGRYDVAYAVDATTLTQSDTSALQASLEGVLVVTADPCPGVLAAIDVLPNAATLSAGQSQQFTAAGRDCYGNAVSISPVWSIDGAIGTIDASSGLFTAAKAGTPSSGTIKASQGAIEGTADVAVDRLESGIVRGVCSCQSASAGVAAALFGCWGLLSRRHRR